MPVTGPESESVDDQETDQLGEAHAESSLQQGGYVRVHRAVLEDTNDLTAAYLYGILEDFAQLGARTGRGCVPSLETLADLCRASVSTVRRARTKLKERGWLSWEQVTPWQTRYTVRDRGHGRPKGGCHSDRGVSQRQGGAVKLDTPPCQIEHATPVNLTPNLELNELERESYSPNGASDLADTPLAPKSETTPYAAWVAFCRGARLDIGAATPDEKSKALGIAKHLLANGVGLADIEGCAAYLRSQSWRRGLLGMDTLASEIGKWRMEGRPAREPEPPPRHEHMTQADWNSGAPGKFVY